MDHQCFSSMHPCWTATPVVILKLLQRYFTPFPSVYPPQIKSQFNKQELLPTRALVINLLTLIINEYSYFSSCLTCLSYYSNLKPIERICCVTFARLVDTKKERLPLINSIKRGVFSPTFSADVARKEKCTLVAPHPFPWLHSMARPQTR